MSRKMVINLKSRSLRRQLKKLKKDGSEVWFLPSNHQFQSFEQFQTAWVSQKHLVCLEVVQAGNLQIGCNDSYAPTKLLNSHEAYAGSQKSICQAKQLHFQIDLDKHVVQGEDDEDQDEEPSRCRHVWYHAVSESGLKSMECCMLQGLLWLAWLVWISQRRLTPKQRAKFSIIRKLAPDPANREVGFSLAIAVVIEACAATSSSIA